MRPGLEDIGPVDAEMVRTARWRLENHLRKVPPGTDPEAMSTTWRSDLNHLRGRLEYYEARLRGESHQEALCSADSACDTRRNPMEYPKAGDLQRGMAVTLTSNPPQINASGSWEVRSSIGLEGVRADRDDADALADEIRRAGGRGVTVERRVRSVIPRPAGAPPMYHAPRGRPPGVPNPENPLSFTAKGERMYDAIKKQYQAKGDPRAKEIAARTVYASAHDGVPGLVKSPLSNPEEDTFDTDILFGMERAIWVTCYADAVEEMSPAERKAIGAPVKLQGIEWSKAAPQLPVSAQMAAQDLYLAYERANGKTPGQLYELACAADGARGTDALAETFGHYLAMMALDHGVSWFDDHAEFKLKQPSFEAHYEDGEIEWSPKIQSRLNPGETQPDALLITDDELLAMTDQEIHDRLDQLDIWNGGKRRAYFRRRDTITRRRR